MPDESRAGRARVRVAHIVSHPIQYFAPLYRELARRPEIDLTVYFLATAGEGEYYDPGFDRRISWAIRLLDGYRSRICPSATRTSLSGRRRRPHWDVVRELWRARYDVVWLHGYDLVTVWLAAAAARLRGTRILLRDEQTLVRSRSWWRRALKRAVLPLLFGRVTGLYIGEENRRYLLHYGVSPDRLVPARYCVDNERFQSLADELLPQRDACRRSFGIDDDAPVVLFCGKLVAFKQPQLLLEAFRRVREQMPCWLLLVGDGSLRGELERDLERRPVPGVAFAGFLDQHEIARAYAAADVLALPSLPTETWGLVVNEAMNFGLPIVASSGVGCVADLVRAGENGFVVDAASPDELAAAIRTLVESAELRGSFGERSRSLIDDYSIERAADGIVEACLAGN